MKYVELLEPPELTSVGWISAFPKQWVDCTATKQFWLMLSSAQNSYDFAAHTLFRFFS